MQAASASSAKPPKGAPPGAQPAQVTRFAYDGSDLILEFDASGQVTHRYLNGPATDMVLADERPAQSGAARVLWPLAVVMGAPIPDAGTVADLIGNKTVINEFFAYAKMSTVQAGMSEKARLIASFALCGFANFSSIGIQIGGIGGLAPTRKGDIARLGFRALLGGSLASFMTATIAGLLAG